MKVQRTYGMKQQMLYTVCKAGWALCLEYLPTFTQFKGFYDEDFVAQQLKVVADAEALPDVLKSNNDRTDARIDLSIASKKVRNNWQFLKAYIENAFIPEKVETMLEGAGSSYFKLAANENWEGTRQLIDTANHFISDYSEILSLKNNMPISFAATFQTDGAACTELATVFAKADMDKELATDKKTNANNLCYAALVRMMADGKQLFKTQPGIKKLFSVNYLISVNGGEGAASLTGYVTNELKLPVAGVLVQALEGKYSAVTDAKGRYRISRIAANTYNFSVTCKGYQSVSEDISFTPGTAARANFTLINMLQETV